MVGATGREPVAITASSFSPNPSVVEGEVQAAKTVQSLGHERFNL
jgi:hypothetical protein